MSAEQVIFRNLTLLKFSPSLLSLYAESAGGSRAVPHTSSEALRASGGEAVLDGPMFDPSGPYPTETYGTVDYKHFDLSSGVNFPTRNPSQGLTISVMPNGGTTVASGSTSAPGARVAVQLYPQLVVNGRPQPVSNQTFSYVAALGVMNDGRMAFIVGRNLSLPNFASQLAEAGVTYAGYTDGGGSTSLETLSGYVGHAEHRRVLTWLVARPSGGAPSAGASVGVIAALLALVGGVGWLWYRRTEKGLSRPRRNPIDTGVWRRTVDRAPALFDELFKGPRHNPPPAESMSLNELYDGDLPNEREMLWDFVGPLELDDRFKVVIVDPVVAYETWTVDGGATTVKEAFLRHAQKWQHELVARYRNDKSLPDTVVLVHGEHVVDGHHRIVALAKNKVRAVKALDLDEPVDTVRLP